jgi:putative ABC transport system substrate-binding protein
MQAMRRGLHPVSTATQHDTRCLDGGRRRLVLAALAVGCTPSVTAQSTRRIGYLATSDPATMPQLEILKRALKAGGLEEGRNLFIDYGWAPGSLESRPEVAAALVQGRNEVIVAYGTPAVQAAQRATTRIPIVMVGVGDPVAAGLVASLAHPGGNVTGVTSLSTETTPKLVELLAQAVPGIGVLGVLRNPGNAAAARQMEEARLAVAATGNRLALADARTPDEIDAAVAELRRQGAAGMVILGDPMFTGQSAKLARIAIGARLPSIHNASLYARAGGLLSYGANLDEVWTLAGRYVVRLLNGTRPQYLPVAQPSKFELVVNTATARSLRISLPREMLERAEHIVE